MMDSMGNPRAVNLCYVAIRVSDIDPSKINTGRDKIDLKFREGGQVESRTVSHIQSQDAGVIVLEVR